LIKREKKTERKEGTEDRKKRSKLIEEKSTTERNATLFPSNGRHYAKYQTYCHVVCVTIDGVGIIGFIEYSYRK
jgi:hypothetical protein